MLAAASIISGCSSRPSDVLSTEDMAQLMADMQVGESVMGSSRDYATDSAKRAFLQALYVKHGVSREEVDSSFSWYGYHIDKYLEVCDRAVEILEQRLEKAQDLAGSSAEGIAEVNTNFEGDSVDVWPSMRWRRLSANMPSDVITFALDNDRNWEKGDVYTLRSKIVDNHGPIIYTIAVDYADGRTEYMTKAMPGDGWHDMQFALDSSRTAQRVYGLMQYTPSRGEVAFIDSISLMRTRWGGHYREARGNIKRFENRSSSSRRKSSGAPLPEPSNAAPANTPKAPGNTPQAPGVPARPGSAEQKPVFVARPLGK